MVNIVMPIWNRFEHTKQTLDSLFSNTEVAFELTVINDYSNIKTTRLLDSYGLKIQNLLYNSVNIGPGASRNRACDYLARYNLRGDYLYFSDNDVYFKKDWLSTLLAAYKKVSKKGVGLIGGGCHPYLQNKEVIDGVGIKDAVSGYSHLLTWELWDRFGPFDTQEGLEKKTGQSDDWKFCQDIKAGGFKVGALIDEVVLATGKTDSYGDPAVGQETFTNKDGVLIS